MSPAVCTRTFMPDLGSVSEIRNDLSTESMAWLTKRVTVLPTWFDSEWRLDWMGITDFYQVKDALNIVLLFVMIITKRK